MNDTNASNNTETQNQTGESPPPNSHHILWGVTGSVAAIRSDLLADQLTKLGDLRLVATSSGRFFLPPLPHTLPVYGDQEEWGDWRQLGDPVLHIELRRWADLLIIAPASADFLAKMAHGICDNLLLCVARAWDYSRPLLVAPAMNTYMWNHPTTAEHLARLRSWGVQIIDPVEKKLACNEVGVGAQAPPETLSTFVAEALQGK